MKALVTGATGLIGMHLVRDLLNHGHEVRAMVRTSGRRGLLAGIPVTVVVADILGDGDDLDGACAGCDVVFHTAAHFAYTGFSSGELHGTALTGTSNVLQACSRQGISRAIVTSSSVVFGYRELAISIDEHADIQNADNEPPYVTAKIAQHCRTLELGTQLNLDVRLACPTMTLGPTSSRLGPSNGLIAAYLADPFGCTFPGGCNIVAARDVAIGHRLIAEGGTAGESYLLGSQNLTWRQIHTMIAELTGMAPPRMELNHTLTYLAAAADELRSAIKGHAPLSTREQASMVGRFYWYSHAKAAALGYSPMSARDALIETISWLATSPHISREVRAGMHLADDIHRFRAASRQSETA